MPRNRCVLIVDDNAATRYAIRRVLEHHDYEVLEAGTGTEGLEMLAACPVSVLVLDVNLPDMSGFDIVRRLRADPATQLLPVVHVSAASIETGDMITGLDAGADAYLIHPVDPDVLLATLRTLLRVRAAEDALRLSEARFREIFENIAAPIAVVDGELHVQQANAAFCRLIPHTGDLATATALFSPGQQAQVEAIQEAVRKGRRWQGIVFIDSGRGMREIEWRIAPYREAELGLLFVEDVTEQRQRDRDQRRQLDTAATELAHQIEARARSESQLMQALKMDALGKLTGGIAHDFNNLLTSIITGVDMMNSSIEQGRPERVGRFADIVIGSARRAAALTQRMLAFARQQPLDPRPFDVNAQVRSLEDLLLRTIGEHITLELQLAPEPAIAKADANQLENVVLNLVINARDALAHGGRIRITTETRHVLCDAELPDGPYVHLAVADDGEGIDPAVLEKVFEPFFTTKPIGEGTGLGLSMTYGFARQSGGVARIRSTPGEGTEVMLLLPAADAVDAPEAVRRPVNAPGASERILLVEDTEAVRVMAAEVLSQAGYRVIQASNVDAAMKYLRGNGTIDLLLSDVGLPGMSGRELAEAARAWRPSLPVLFMTGYTGSAMERADFLGPRMEMLLKPFEIDDLLEKVRKVLG